MMSQNVLNLELIEHETCSDLLLSLLQNILIFLYSKNLFDSNRIGAKGLSHMCHLCTYVQNLVMIHQPWLKKIYGELSKVAPPKKTFCGENYATPINPMKMRLSVINKKPCRASVCLYFPNTKLFLLWLFGKGSNQSPLKKVVRSEIWLILAIFSICDPLQTPINNIKKVGWCIYTGVYTGNIVFYICPNSPILVVTKEGQRSTKKMAFLILAWLLDS